MPSTRPPAVVDDVLGWNAAAHFRGIDEPPGSPTLARRNDIIRLGLLQLAQVDLWRAEDIVPEGVVSVSLGEMVAPYAAGAISRADCARILAVVAHAISRTPTDNGCSCWRRRSRRRAAVPIGARAHATTWVR